MRTELVGAAITCPRCGEDRLEGLRLCSRCGLDLAGARAAGAPAAGAPAAETADASPAALPAERRMGAPAAVIPAAITPAAPAAWPPPAVPQAKAPASGRRVSRTGRLAVIGGALVLVGAVVAVAAAGLGALPGAGPDDDARWDGSLHLPATIADRRPFEVEAEVLNDGDARTERVWLVIEWRPADLAFDADAHGRVVNCDPRTCEFRDDGPRATSTVVWPGLDAGERRVLSVTVEVQGIEAGHEYVFRVRTGVGADEGTLGGGNTWTLDVAVEAPAAGMRGTGGSG